MPSRPKGEIIDTPVLIVGGGPVGLALALDLGWRGVPCTLVERTDGTIQMPKMNVVNVRTMEFCRRWGIADAVRQCPFPDDYPMDVAFVTRVTGHELGRVERPARRFQKPLDASPANMQVCPQFWFDPILLERARAYPHVRILHRHEFKTFDILGEGVVAQVTDLDSGKQIEIRARHLAGCDGASSRIREKLAIGLLGSAELSRSLHMFFRTPDLLRRLGARATNFYLFFDEQGFWGSLRVMDPVNGLWRLMIDSLPDDVDAEKIDFDAVLLRALGKPITVEWLNSSLWTRRGVIAEHYAKDPVYLVGDAVHQVSPTGGLGMNTGIADAVDLAWKLAAVHEGWGGAKLLSSYSAERQPAGARVVRMTTEFFEGTANVKEGLQEIDADTPAGMVLREDLGRQLAEVTAREFRTLGLQLGYWYADSPICIADGTPSPVDDPHHYHPSARPGSRAPHVPLADGRSSLDLLGPGFTLLRLSPRAPDPAPLLAAALKRRLPLQVVDLDEAPMRRVYETGLVLVRPDGHVAWRGDSLPPDAMSIIDRVRGA
ncbi:MAG: FAD-dependent monooxygenase [Burkholderiales bacterium]